MAIDINFGALQTPNPFAAYTQGVDAGQKMRVLKARQAAGNLFSQDPQAAAQMLVSANDIEGAKALSDLSYTAQNRDLVMRGAGLLFGGGSPTPNASSASAAPATASAAQAPAAQDSAPQVDPAVAQQRLEHFDTTAQLLQSIPYGPQRKAALQQAVPDLAKNGLPPDKIASFDPTDDNLNQLRSSLAQLADQIPTSAGAAPSASPSAPQGLAAAPQPPAGAAAPTPSGAPPIDLRDPNTVKAIGLMGMGNPQLGSFLTSLGTASMPKYAPGRAGAPIMDERTGKITGFAPTSEGVQYDVGPDGAITGAHAVPGYASAVAGYKGTVAGATTHAEHAAAAPYEMITVKQPDGSEVQMTLAQFQALKGSGQMPGLGQGPTPGAQENQKADAKNFADEVNTHGATAVISTQNARTVTEQAINLAQNLNPNAWTASAGKVANVLNAAGFKVAAPAANDISTYTALLPQVLRGTFTTFPRLDKEFHVIQMASANVNTPKDAATILLATQAAVQARNNAYAQFVQNWNGPPSKQAMTRAFLASPQGNTSIFADPIWRNLQIGGSPAVMVGSKPLPDGHVYGVFRPGTPYAQTFMVQ